MVAVQFFAVANRGNATSPTVAWPDGTSRAEITLGMAAHAQSTNRRVDLFIEDSDDEQTWHPWFSATVAAGANPQGSTEWGVVTTTVARRRTFVRARAEVTGGATARWRAEAEVT